MGIKFPSPDWTAAFKDAINANDAYAKSGKGWTHGKVAYVVKGRADLGFADDVAMILDMVEGKCLGAQYADAATAESADFVIWAEYELWKDVLSGQLDPTKAMMQNKLKLKKGHLPTIVKYVVANKALVRSALTMDTDYPA